MKTSLLPLPILTKPNPLLVAMNLPSRMLASLIDDFLERLALDFQRVFSFYVDALSAGRYDQKGSPFAELIF